MVQYGKVRRGRWSVTVDWLPQVQAGAILTLYLPDSETATVKVTGYQHKPWGKNNLVTKLELEEYGDPAGARTPPVAVDSPVSVSAQVELLTNEILERVDQGYVVPSGGTTVPTTPTIGVALGVFKGIVLSWDKQTNLTNLDYYELQVTDDISGTPTWYSLKTDGTGWQGTSGLATVVNTEFFVHSGIPLDTSGGADDPAGVTLYYRVRRVTKLSATSDWSATATGTTKTISAGELAESSVYANNIQAGVIEAIVATIRSSLTIDSTTGWTAEAVDTRAYMTEDAIALQAWSGSTWVNKVLLEADGDVYLAGDLTIQQASKKIYLGPTTISPRITNKQVIEIGGSTSSALISVQDGNGRLQLKWNATHGTSETFLVAGENAYFEDFTIATNPIKEWKYASGSGKAAGDSITWTTLMQLTENDYHPWAVKSILGTISLVAYTDTAGSGIADASTNQELFYMNYSSKYIAMYTNSSERLRIDSSGNVAIGTTDPAGYKLRVAGDVKIDGSLSISDMGPRTRTTGALTANQTVTISAGFWWYYMVYTSGQFSIRIKDSTGTWYVAAMVDSTSQLESGLIISDGTNAQFYTGTG
jgi:hypothetical protein